MFRWSFQNLIVTKECKIVFLICWSVHKEAETPVPLSALMRYIMMYISDVSYLHRTQAAKVHRNEGFFVTPYYSCRIAGAGGGWTHFHYLLSWCPHTYCRFGIYWLLCNKISLLKGWFGWKVNWEYHKLKLYATSENICGWWHQTPRLVCDPHTQPGDFIQFRSF